MKCWILIGFISLLFSGYVNASAGIEYYLGGGTLLGALGVLGWLLLFGGIPIVIEFIGRLFTSKNKNNDKE